jgi:ankyrin repeat protein
MLRSNNNKLRKAASSGETEVVRQLLEAAGGTKYVMAKDNFGMTPLHRACNFGHLDTAVLLLEKGALINDKNKIEWTPLYVFERTFRFSNDFVADEDIMVRFC